MHALAVTLLLAAGQPPAPPAEVLRLAEEAFAAGVRDREAGGAGRDHFRAAARHYESLRDGGARNPELFRNLGNAHLLAGDLPRAILAYRLGLRLAPNDRALRDALRRARAQVIYVEGSAVGRPPEDLWPAWLPAWGPAGSYGAAALLSLAGWASLARWLMRRRTSLLMAGLGLLALAAGASWLALRGHDRPARPVAVLARDGVLLRRGNDRAFAPRHSVPLNRGVEAEVLHARDGWLQVELAGGEVGWVAPGEAFTE